MDKQPGRAVDDQRQSPVCERAPNGQSASSAETFFVAVREAQDVVPGDVIWAPDDGDWLTVARVGGKFQPTFYRADGSEASVAYDDSKVLVRA